MQKKETSKNSASLFPPISLQMLARIAVLVALDVILMNFLGIHTQFIKFGFSFVPIVLCAMLYGPLWAGVCAGVGDILNCIVFPVGPYFPGFTLTAVLMGIVFGVGLRNHSDSLWRIFLTVSICQIGLSLGLNTYFLTILYHTDFSALWLTRVTQCLLLIPIQVIVIRLLGSKKLVAALRRRPLRAN